MDIYIYIYICICLCVCIYLYFHIYCAQVGLISPAIAGDFCAVSNNESRYPPRSLEISLKFENAKICMVLHISGVDILDPTYRKLALSDRCWNWSLVQNQRKSLKPAKPLTHHSLEFCQLMLMNRNFDKCPILWHGFQPVSSTLNIETPSEQKM